MTSFKYNTAAHIRRIKPNQTRNVGQCPTWWPPCQI